MSSEQSQFQATTSSPKSTHDDNTQETAVTIGNETGGEKTEKKKWMTWRRKKNDDGINADNDDDETKKKEAETKAPMGNYWRIISQGAPLDHILFAAAVTAAAASGVAMPLMNIVFGNLAGEFNGYFLENSTVTEQEFKASVRTSSLYFVYLFLGKFALSYIAMFSFRFVALRISAELRLAYMSSLLAQPLSKLDTVSSGTVSQTITSSANTIQMSISDRLAFLFQGLALVVAAYAIAFRYSWALTLVTSSIILFIIVVYSFSTPVVLKAHQRILTADAMHSSVAGEIFSSIRTVFSLGAEQQLSARYFKYVEESRRHGLSMAPLVGIQLAPIFFAMYASFALAFWFGLKLYYEGTIANVNSVIIVFFSVLIVVSIMANIVQPIMDVTKAVTASVGFFEMIDSDPVFSQGLKEPDVSAHEDLEFHEVNFSYPTRPGVQVLKEFTAKFQKGKTTALVGPSGSGKSTIVGMVERWYRLKEPVSELAPPPETSATHEDKTITEVAGVKIPNSGTITCGGAAIDTFDLRWWRTQIGLVQQEPFLFNDTIFNNVSFGLLGTQWENVPQAEKMVLVEEACREAFADEFITKLPQKYETMVGESGIKLSGGQRQRLAIARSIVRKPAILILDEATSAIDVRSEKIVQAALDRVSKERTTLVIAHRLATIRKADHIIVLRNGVKVEEGTHTELLSDEEGLYSGLVRAQQIQEDTDTDSVTSGGNDDLDLLRKQSTAHESIHVTAHPAVAKAYKNKNFFSSVLVFVFEQPNDWIFLALTLAAALGCGAAFSLQSWFFARLMEVFQFTGQKLIDGRNFWALMFFILALAMAVCYFGLGFASSLLTARVAAVARTEYFQHIIRHSVPFFDQDNHTSGSLMSQLSTDPKQLSELLGLNGAFPMMSVFNLSGCVIIAFYFGWKLSLVVVFAAMPVLLASHFVKIKNEYQYEEMNSKVFSKSSSFATEAIGAMRTVSSLTMEDMIVQKYRTMLQDQVRASTRRATYATLINALCDSSELAAMALTFWYGGQLLASKEYNLVQFYLIYVAIIQGAIAAGQFFSSANQFAFATASANRILAMREGSNALPSSTKSLPINTTNFGAKVDIEHVTFQYPTRETPTFRNLSVSIPAGSFAAFVGPSGCGKTTVISLLERFYDPLSGTITVDGSDIFNLDVASYRRSLSLVAQEPRLFDGSIRENLLLGIDLATTTVTDDDMHQACRDAEIHDFIISLPDGYGTSLGMNTATSLSGGQKQRLCLARALLRKPKLLLLDEATSSLDSQSEKLVQTAIERLAGQRKMTVVAVAHRLATIQKADTIFVFGEGGTVGEGARVVERGSHGELLRRRGVYWQMCQAQALDR